ncbi:MAG: FAD-dependent oxidoreductase [Oscillospiraceae bacterium]
MQTLWNSRDTLPAYPPLREDLHADAAVVGGGMAGILTAYALHTRGLRVVLLEGSRLASGVTAHTTAKITAQHGRFCERLVHDFGFHLARQYLQANLCAVRQFRALVRQKRIDCGFSDESSFIYAAPDGPSLTRELEYALSLGAPARLVKPEGLPLSGARGALLRAAGAALAAAVPRGAAAGADGLRAFPHARHPRPRRPLRRRHGHGGADRCRHALPHARALRALRPAAAAGALVPPCADRRAAAPGMWLDAGEEGWSLRRSGRYLLLGGGGHRCGENLGDSYDRLRAQAQRLFPQRRRRSPGPRRTA